MGTTTTPSVYFDAAYYAKLYNNDSLYMTISEPIAEK